MNFFRNQTWRGPILFFIFWLGLQSIGGRFLQDPGMFWHTRTGERILEQGFIRSDPYTFTFHGTWWVPYQWLGEVCMAILHRANGLDTLLVTSTALLAALFAWIATRSLSTGLNPIFALAIVAVAVAAASTHFHVRPHLFSLVAIGITTAIILAYEHGRITLREFIWLIPLFIIWTNIHGAVLGGISTLLLVWGGWTTWRLVGWSSPIRGTRDFLGMSAIVLTCSLSVFCSPYGLDMPRTWFLITSMPRLPELIQEHSRFDFSNPMGWPLIAFASLFCCVLFGVKALPRASWLLPLAWLIQAYLRVRHGSIFAVVGVLVLLEIWPHTRWAQWLAIKRPDIYTPPTVPRRDAWKAILVTFLVGLAAVIGLQVAKVPVPLFGPDCAKLDSQRWPTEVLDTLREYAPVSPGSPNHIFNDYIDGGFIIYHAPQYQVFVDDRCEVFGDDWIADLVEASGHQTAQWMDKWQSSEKYGLFDFALTRTDSEFDKYFRSRPNEWQLLKEGQYSALYKRRR